MTKLRLANEKKEREKQNFIDTLENSLKPQDRIQLIILDFLANPNVINKMSSEKAIEWLEIIKEFKNSEKVEKWEKKLYSQMGCNASDELCALIIQKKDKDNNSLSRYNVAHNLFSFVSDEWKKENSNRYGIEFGGLAKVKPDNSLIVTRILLVQVVI